MLIGLRRRGTGGRTEGGGRQGDIRQAHILQRLAHGPVDRMQPRPRAAKRLDLAAMRLRRDALGERDGPVHGADDGVDGNGRGRPLEPITALTG